MGNFKLGLDMGTICDKFCAEKKVKYEYFYLLVHFF